MAIISQGPLRKMHWRCTLELKMVNCTVICDAKEMLSCASEFSYQVSFVSLRRLYLYLLTKQIRADCFERICTDLLVWSKGGYSGKFNDVFVEELKQGNSVDLHIVERNLEEQAIEENIISKKKFFFSLINYPDIYIHTHIYTVPSLFFSLLFLPHLFFLYTESPFSSALSISFCRILL